MPNKCEVLTAQRSVANSDWRIVQSSRVTLVTGSRVTNVWRQFQSFPCEKINNLLFSTCSSFPPEIEGKWRHFAGVIFLLSNSSTFIAVMTTAEKYHLCTRRCAGVMISYLPRACIFAGLTYHHAATLSLPPLSFPSAYLTWSTLMTHFFEKLIKGPSLWWEWCLLLVGEYQSSFSGRGRKKE